MKESVAVAAYTLTSALGVGLDAHRAALRSGAGGLAPAYWPNADVDTWLGAVDALAASGLELEPEWDSRNNRLAQLALKQDGFDKAVGSAVRRFGADRLGVLMGTSTSSVGRTERAYRELRDDGRWPESYVQPNTHHPHSAGAFVAQRIGAEGPALTISTACSSSARVFASAERWLRAGIVDAVVVGGVDTLCLSVIYGFHSLQLVSPTRCRPFDINRDGLNLGEAGGFALLTARRDTAEPAGWLKAYGESSDAHHMSSAHPEGLGARLAIELALARGGLEPGDIGYLNLHGTSTPANDAIEGKLCASLFDTRTRMSATKGWTGHALGAAGIVEAALCLDVLTCGWIPGTLGTEHVMSEIAEHLVLEGEAAQPRYAMTNSFGFGGNNCSLIFEAPG